MPRGRAERGQPMSVPHALRPAACVSGAPPAWTPALSNLTRADTHAPCRARRRALRSWSASIPAARSPISSASRAARCASTSGPRRPTTRRAPCSTACASCSACTPRRRRDDHLRLDGRDQRRARAQGRARRAAHHRRLRGRPRDRPADAARALCARAGASRRRWCRAHAGVGVAERLTRRRRRAACR